MTETVGQPSAFQNRDHSPRPIRQRLEDVDLQGFCAFTVKLPLKNSVRQNPTKDLGTALQTSNFGIFTMFAFEKG
jgi:hypothetical protein